MTREIKLTQGKVALVDDDMFDYLDQWKWNCGSSGYAQRTITVDGKRVCVYMHRYILGANANGLQVDHADGNPLNNIKANLRSCSSKSNNANRKLKPGRKYKGVYKKGSKWTVEIKHFNKNIWIGSFACEHEAALAYNDAARNYHGEFARLNVVE